MIIGHRVKKVKEKMKKALIYPETIKKEGVNMARYDKELSNRKIRKRIRFERKDGAPVTKCSIGLTQKKHSFLFGCGGFVFIPYVAEGLPENREATESWLDVFNYATLPFYWGNYEREEGKTNRDALMKTAVYLKERGVTIKGHPLC